VSLPTGSASKFGRRAKRFAVVLVLLGLVVGLPANCGRMMGLLDPNSDEALERLRTCPKAAKALGADIEIALGFGCGSGEKDDFRSNSDMSLPVAGSKARGRYRYHMVKNDLGSKYSGRLEVDGAVIAITPSSCK